MVKLLKFLAGHRVISSITAVLLGAAGVGSALVFMFQKETELIILPAVILYFFSAVLLCGITLAIGGIKPFIYAGFYLFFILLGILVGVLILRFSGGQSGIYSPVSVAVAVIPAVLLGNKLRLFVLKVTGQDEKGATEDVIEISQKIYAAAAADFTQADSLTTSPMAYRAYTENDVLRVYNLSAYDSRDILMTNLLTVKARLSENAAKTSAFTDRLRRVKYSFFAGFYINGQAGEFTAYIYYTPALAASVYRAVNRLSKSYCKNAVITSVPDPDWLFFRLLIPAEKYILSDINDIICTSAEKENMLDKESTLFFNIVLFTPEDIKAYAAEAGSRGYTPYIAYAREDCYILLLTRIMTVNRDSLDACTDMLSDMAAQKSGKVGSYGYNFNDEIIKEVEGYENIL